MSLYLFIPMLVISSSFGATDCSGCQIFNKGTTLFAKRIMRPGSVSLAIKIAEMRDTAATMKALRRIENAIETGENFIELIDLE